MNPFILFDYIFYKIAWFFDVRFNYSQTKKQAGVGFLSLFQFFNILALLNLLKKDILVSSPYFVFIIGYLLLFGLNFLRYIVILKFEKFELKWGNEERNSRLLRGVLIIVYFILSVFLINP